jgi:hypothetical protein
MRELPNVTVIGDTSGGHSGDPRFFTLSDGWRFTVSTWIDYTAEMLVIEDPGIDPATFVPANAADFQAGKDPVLEDPRYLYRGTGSKRSCILYAFANSVICKGDNGHWQPNYSRVLGHLAAAGISNLYYPAKDRHGATLTFENTAIGIGGSMVANLLHKFVVRRFTPKAPKATLGTP